MGIDKREDQRRMLEQWRKENPPTGGVISGENREDMHLRALEGCLLSFQMQLSKMPGVEKVIRKMRKKTRRKIRGKFTEENKAIAAKGLAARKLHWNTYYTELDESYARLESQLEITEDTYPQLASDARDELIDILQNCKRQKAPSKNHKADAVMQAWNTFVQQMKTTLEAGENILPGIEAELATMRTSIKAAMQTE